LLQFSWEKDIKQTQDHKNYFGHPKEKIIFNQLPLLPRTYLRFARRISLQISWGHRANSARSTRIILEDMCVFGLIKKKL
tara:strand:- start:3012 stop:3251 length:240 start_codon:yes stop_codon:yes gene_type:complete